MTLDQVVRSQRLRTLAREGPLGPHLDGFLDSVSSIGFTPGSLRDLLYGAIHFGKFLVAQGRADVRDLSERHIADFVASLPVYLCRGRYSMRASRRVRAARHLLRYLRAVGVAPPQPPPPPRIFSPLLEEWLTFLQHHRGLAAKSLDLYRRHITRFLESLGPDATASGLHRLGPERIREYVLTKASAQSRSERKALVSTLRIFLRFALSRGYLTRDLTVAVDRVPCFKDEQLPRGPRWKDVLRLPGTVDRTTAQGRRDFAVLLILVAYGIRAGQLCHLCLEDLDWHGARIRFTPAKGGRWIELPLLPTVGEAILDYLQAGRPRTASRRIFLSTDPPFRPLAITSIYNIVSAAFRAAGVESPHRGSHAIRHAWATQMLAQGRSLKTIADLLGHRSPDTTRIYAKVDYTRLREVGLPWPQEVAR